MQFIDLKRQQAKIRSLIDSNIKDVLDHGNYINGPELFQLEKKLSDYVGTKFAVGVSNGTDALLMPLMYYGIKPGDAVFTSAFSFFATSEVISLLGAVPVFVDIENDCFNIDPNKLEDAVKKTVSKKKYNARGIIPVDLFGQAADYDDINAIAKKFDLFVLEDAAQSFGGRYKGKRNCSLAEVASTSFFPAKPLGCYGDGGMIFTDSPEINDALVSIRVHGKGSDKYNNVRIGINGRLDTLQAAILLAKFEIFNEELEAKNRIAERYSLILKDHVKTPEIRKGNFSAWAQYSIIHPKRDKIIDFMRKKDIPAMIYYPRPLPFQSVYKNMKFQKGDFPVSEKISDEIFSLPMHAYLTDDEITEVSDAVIEAVKKI
jgi:UDP-2-acetamido-2-deoxy-ribo-hexuluronate aminotransferase